MSKKNHFTLPNIAYFAPNIYGISGYSLIAPLLLLFDKIIISNPTYGYISSCARDENYETTSLTPDEFFKYIINGYIIPTGFETFFNEYDRKKYYQKSPILLASNSFDIELMRPNFELKIQKLKNNYKSSISPYKAIQFTSQNDLFKNRISQLLIDKNIQKRYEGFYSDRSSTPKELREIADYKGIDNIELTAWVAYYDFLNNSYASYCYHKQYNQQVLQIQDSNNTEVYEAICEISGLKQHPYAYVPLLISKSLKTCTKHIPKDKKWRLTPAKINYFRREHKANFIKFITSIVWDTCDREPDPILRLREVEYKLNEKFDNLKKHLDPETIGILKKLAPPLSFIPISTLQNHPVIQKAIYRGQKPFGVFDQCLYQFLTDPVHYK